MSSRFGGAMATIVLSSVLSASVAVVVTQVVAPQYASAKSHSKAPTLTSLAKSISADYKATSAQLGALEGDLASLKTSVAAVSSSASAADTNANAANAAVTAIAPIVHTIAERLYDTCALTSDLWGRSFPDNYEQNGHAWAQTATEATSLGFEGLQAESRCYAAAATLNVSDPQLGGILVATSTADDSWTAPVP